MGENILNNSRGLDRGESRLDRGDSTLDRGDSKLDNSRESREDRGNLTFHRNSQSALGETYRSVISSLNSSALL